jgi:hypothetical protein
MPGSEVIRLFLDKLCQFLIEFVTLVVKQGVTAEFKGNKLVFLYVEINKTLR